MLFSANQNALHTIFFIEVFGVPGTYRYKNDVINNFAVVMSAVINKVDCNKEYSRLSLSRSRRDPLKHFEISVLRHIRCAELRKIPNEQPNFTHEHVI